MSEELSLSEQLKSQIDRAHWKLLEDHHKRGALLLVSLTQDLVDVGVAIAQDNVQKIKELLDNGHLIRTTEELVAGFDKEENLEFNFIIIQPYVLIQNVNESEDMQ